MIDQSIFLLFITKSRSVRKATILFKYQCKLNWWSNHALHKILTASQFSPALSLTFYCQPYFLKPGLSLTSQLQFSSYSFTQINVRTIPHIIHIHSYWQFKILLSLIWNHTQAADCFLFLRCIRNVHSFMKSSQSLFPIIDPLFLFSCPKVGFIVRWSKGCFLFLLFLFLCCGHLSKREKDKKRKFLQKFNKRPQLHQVSLAYLNNEIINFPSKVQS